jgi:hypothetical protein
MDLGHGSELEFTLDQPDVDGSKSLFPAQDGWENEEGEPEVLLVDLNFHVIVRILLTGDMQTPSRLFIGD